jgi:hypothetical protein
MTRVFVAAVALVCLGLGVVILPALSQPPGKAAPPKGPPVTKAQEETLAIMNLLRQPIATKGLQEKVKLKTALELFVNIFKAEFNAELPILVDKEAFAAELGADAPDPYEEEVVLPPVPNRMVVGTALRLILSQIGKGQATFLIRQGHLEIVPAKNTTAAYFLREPSIVAIFKQRPLQEVLQELSDETGFAIHLDPNIGDKGNTPIVATFRNCSLEAALVTVTEMAQLKYVAFEHSIYVTTPDKAKVLEKEEKVRRKQRESAPGRATKRLEPAAE